MFAHAAPGASTPHAPPTYRHVLSPAAFTVHNPLRVVALIDSDAFYAACEQVRLGLDPDRPIAVQQWQGLIAINYPARKYGITRMMSVTEAKKKCPALICVHVMTYREGSRTPGYYADAQPSTHKVSLDYYRRESIKVLRIFQSTLPGAEVERASIDEAFFDLSAPVREELLKRYPYLAQVPADAPEGMDSPLPAAPVIDWAGKGHVLPVREGEGAEEEADDGWADVALSIGAEMVDRVRQEVRAQLGYTTSAGIARNKTMAKLCASCKKPFGQTILRDAAIPLFLRPMPFQKIRFLGGKLGDAIASAYDATTIGDLLSVSREDMQAQFGEEAGWVHQILRGEEYAEVRERTGVKSMLASKNVRPAIKTFAEGQHWLRVLASELALRLEEAREATPGVWPKTLVLHLRQAGEPARSRQCPFPFTPALSDEPIARVGERLLRELVGPGERIHKEVFNVSLGFAGLELGEQGQRSIVGFFGGREPEPPAELGGKRKRSATQERERATPSPEAERLGSTSNSNSNPNSNSNSPAPPKPIQRPQSQPSYTCPRCAKVLRPLASAAGEGEGEGDREEELARLLELLRAEHEDFHFALDLQAEDAVLEPVPAPAPAREERGEAGREREAPRKKRKRKEKEREGIAAYFQKR
ncbi:DNA/RNA polymerase [Calocera cornea HHB12733]|uniref:DNA polymerase eta n=1 Tax=Calocera cornea HHB12733 TaxID=1353952 RepID=A0A165GE43_9BASI|nr:DNA/RNA polymerase [Calocera cornea HHB12733]